MSVIPTQVSEILDTEPEFKGMRCWTQPREGRDMDKVDKTLAIQRKRAVRRRVLSGLNREEIEALDLGAEYMGEPVKPKPVDKDRTLPALRRIRDARGAELDDDGVLLRESWNLAEIRDALDSVDDLL